MSCKHELEEIVIQSSEIEEIDRWHRAAIFKGDHGVYEFADDFIEFLSKQVSYKSDVVERIFFAEAKRRGLIAEFEYGGMIRNVRLRWRRDTTIPTVKVDKDQPRSREEWRNFFASRPTGTDPFTFLSTSRQSGKSQQMRDFEDQLKFYASEDYFPGGQYF